MSQITYNYTANTNLLVSISELKEHLRLETSYTSEDTVLTGYIKAATAHAESYCNRFFLDTDITAYFDEFPTDEIRLYKGKVSQITSVSYQDQDSVTQTWASSKYRTDLHSIPARIQPKQNESFPETDREMNNITIQYKVGWPSASDVPEAIKIAIKLIAARMYLIREDSSYKTMTAAENYLNPYRLNYL